MRRHPLIDFHTSWDQQEFESSGKACWPDKYNEHIWEFSDLLNKRSSESKIHVFLEKHPYLLPGIDSFHHGPYAGIVVSKFPLGNDFITDFAFISSNSQTLQLTCVEIESARKCLFRKDGHFHRDYLDAKQQIIDWLFWAKQNANHAIDCWKPLLRKSHLEHNTVRYQGYLVMGRRRDIDNREKQERWSAEAESLNSCLGCMTYDRLLENMKCLIPDMDNDRLVTCKYSNRRFQAKHVIS